MDDVRELAYRIDDVSSLSTSMSGSSDNFELEASDGDDQKDRNIMGTFLSPPRSALRLRPSIRIDLFNEGRTEQRMKSDG